MIFSRILLLFTFNLLPALCNFFILSDLHYDIVYEPGYDERYRCHSDMILGQTEVPVPTSDIRKLVRPYCDSSYSLISQTFEQMKEIDPAPEFILITGDLIGHDTSDLLDENGDYNHLSNINLIKQSFSDITDLALSHFPDVQIIPMIGNNDAYVDYKMPQGWTKLDYLNFLHSQWKPLVGIISPSFFTDGYYSTTTSSGFTVIVLNTMLFSKQQKEDLAVGDEEMAWLISQLDSNSNIIIAMHIPPSMSLFERKQSWHDHYTKDFIKAIQDYEAKIIAIFGGHFHTGSFQLIGSLPIILNPSVSPSFGNNPGFRYYKPSETDYVECNLNGFNWHEGWSCESFTSVYGFRMNYRQLFEKLDSGEVSVQTYLERLSGYWVLNDVDSDEMCRSIFGDICLKEKAQLQNVITCQIQYLISSEYYQCLDSEIFSIN